MKIKMILAILMILVVSIAVNGQNKYENKQSIKDVVSIKQNTNLVNDYLKEGNRLFNKNEFGKAIIKYEMAIELDPFNPNSYAYMGLSKLNLKDFEGALKDFDNALNLMPNYAEVFYLRGIVKDEINKRDKACEDWKKAEDLGMNQAKEMIKEFCNCEVSAK
ncbi:MAG: hypothetical protein KA792_06280 [Bacteroidales bacterium]|nr:hypothetical protein [Bacteroidales bacterium]